MRKLSLFFAFVLSGVLCAAPQSAQAAQTWALLIGVSQYQNPQITSLSFPAADAQGIRNALTDPLLGALPAENVHLLTNADATRDGILQSVETFLKPNVKAGDQVIVFLAGHGVSKGVGTEAKSYLLPNDAKGLTTAALKMSAVDLNELSNQLAQLPAAQFVVFVDACRDDPSPGRGIKGNLLSDVMSRGVHVVPQTAQPATSVTFFACSVGERAYEDATLGHGVFTYWILDAIKQAAVPQKPDGAIPMGRLASYVGAKVQNWAKGVSDKGGFDVAQTPETLVSEPREDSIVLLRVKRPLSDTPYTAAPPKLLIPTYPAGAQVKINGEAAGAGSVSVDLKQAGEYQLEVIASGYEPAKKTVRVFDGLQYQIPMRLQPGARSGAANPQSDDLYKRAADAEERSQYEIAQAGYEMTIGADAGYQPAYERLAGLQARSGERDKALSTLTQMVSNVAPNARAFGLLARAYADFADEKQREDTAGGLKMPELPEMAEAGPYRVPSTWVEAAALSRKAADEAINAERNSADAQLALGFALTVAPDKAKNKSEALGAFGKAAFMEPKDAENHYGLGYGIRSFAVLQKDDKNRKSELNRAVAALKQALALRPDYYEANRELAYCYHLLDQTQAAVRQYEVAASNRGDANNSDDVAGTEVALSALYRQAAQKARGKQKTDYLAAADGYLSDARETSKDMQVALSILSSVGLNTRLTSYLPGELQTALRVFQDPAAAEAEVRGKIRDKIRLPGGFGF